MESLLLNRWIQIGAVALLVGIAIGVLIPFSVFSGDSGTGLAPVRPLITAGGTAIQGGEGMPGGVAGTEINLPQTATEAIAAGWKDPVLCSVGRGRYFQKAPEGDDDPYFLMFNHQDGASPIHQPVQNTKKPLERQTAPYDGDWSNSCRNSTFRFTTP